MKRAWVFIAAASFSVLTTSITVLPGIFRPTEDHFKIPCGRFPFGGIRVHQLIDANCPSEGKVDDPNEMPDQRRAHIAQNIAKNNFCANGPPIPVRFPVFMALQQLTVQALRSRHIPWGARGNLPPDRSILKNGFAINGVRLGEGSLVSLEA
jgi:hypothetical protein